MIKTVTLLTRRPDLTLEEFHRHWKFVHAPLVLAMPHVRRYVQCSPVNIPDKEPPYDGIAEVWYDNFEDLQATVGSPECDRLLADEKNFMGAKTENSIFVIVEEDEILMDTN
jgi:uncharacterized protein (TIGR02118 family)